MLCVKGKGTMYHVHLCTCIRSDAISGALIHTSLFFYLNCDIADWSNVIHFRHAPEIRQWGSSNGSDSAA